MPSLLATARRKLFLVVHFTAKPFAAIPPFHRFYSPSANPNPIPDLKSPNFIVDYLISSFGFSPGKAATVSKKIAHIKSPEKPDSVRHFLNYHGFTDPQIKTMITWRPEILCSSTENTLEPNLRSLREMGLSNSAVTQIILSNPAVLLLRTAMPRIKFWKDFLGGSEAALVRACRASRGLSNYDIAPKISLLLTLGLSTHEIQRIVLTVAQFIHSSPALIKDLINRVKQLGFQPGSPMFVYGLQTISWNSREALQKKMELLKSYGWSEDDFFAALRKSPCFVNRNENNLRTKMDFLMAEVRCTPSSIASYPVIFSYSLEKRFRPRHHVLCLLELHGLSSKKQKFCYVVKMTDSKFVESYVLPYKEKIPGLYEDYRATCA